MNEWRPIETAIQSIDPFFKDVSECLVYGPECGVKVGRAFRTHYGAIIANANGFHGNWGITHWMPLPPPPTQEPQA